MKAPTPDCTSCGACCFNTLPEAVRVTGDDHARLADDAEAYTWFKGNRCYMCVEDGRCAALAVDPATGRFTCRIYERRPQVCRDLAQGGAACEAERWEKSHRVHVTVQRMLRRSTRS